MLYIASDHAGFKLKEKIKYFLRRKKLSFLDLGPNSEKLVDYPDYAKKLVKRMKKNDLGILICGSGIGMCISANRSKKIRAAQVYDKFTAINSKQHNNSNVICLRSRNFRPGKSIKLLELWLKTSFLRKSRYKRRIAKIS